MTELELIAAVQRSGSLVIKNSNTLAVQAEIDNASTGYIFSPEKKAVYSVEEFKKTNDVEVTELIPDDQETELDLVPRPLYEEVLEALADSLQTIEVQSRTIAELETTVTELENQIENLREEVDNEKLLRILAEENSESNREELLIITNEVQSALQRSILDGIEKSSLEAKNEGLNAQVEALKDEIADLQYEIDQLNKSLQGKDAQIEAGAKSTTEMTANVLEKGLPDSEDLTLDSIKYNTDSDPFGDGKWLNGPTIEFYNPTTEVQKIKFDISGVTAGGGVWIKPIPDISVNPNERKSVKVQTNGGTILSAKPINRAQSAQSYRGKIIVRANSTQLTLTTRLYKHKSR